jgi:triphosphoribosyl-dephospho-CoA synthetase
MINYYLITTFVVLLIGAETADKVQSGAQYLLDQGAAPSRKGQLAHQRF